MSFVDIHDLIQDYIVAHVKLIDFLYIVLQKLVSGQTNSNWKYK